jgi:hypothetical protein
MHLTEMILELLKAESQGSETPLDTLIRIINQAKVSEIRKSEHIQMFTCKFCALQVQFTSWANASALGWTIMQGDIRCSLCTQLKRWGDYENSRKMICSQNRRAEVL